MIEETVLPHIGRLLSIYRCTNVVSVIVVYCLERKEMFYLTMHSTHFIYGYMVKDHSDSERGNQQPQHELFFLISSKGSFICTIRQTG